MSEHTFASIDTGDASGAMAAVATRAASMPPLALLYSEETLLAHVETALGEMGATVVYRAPLGAADRDVLLGAGPQIVLINLDDRCDDRLDQVAAWLDAAQVPVVFNDADISRGLEGWPRARWVRHLAAKLRGSKDVDPPRPAQALPAQKPPAAALPAESAPNLGAFDNDTATFTPIVPIASRPLTPGEIESLVVDFPAEMPPPAAEDADNTEAMAAHVDALLAAQSGAAASAEPAPWEVVMPLEDVPQAAAANSASTSAAAPPAASIPGSSSWQLVDEAEPVVSAPREKPAEAKPAVRIEFDFELEPLEASAPVAAIRDREVEEMRLDHVVAGSPERGE